ncbi:SusC/RagA family TonB-linked outer membrane protein [Neolewinella lacunae]|uniref:SusC/RagA family TonB-linked outer membrane protein n=1 Tax=Neolewinella lacunae TaxID=1517758 RepID=A0A923TDG3_9BACT|nr:SusC/RagA family TonB-linked outer membrane protein [Neolewinella lacunae]MBC6994812.1 SusC/RagA family TonB-linked outer membrane protein [Neolewinella lacunae]MDN3634434.1 SusC/RagA family TonB-linked outer membrane protein [Neolewinella lacunae]
MLRWLLIVCLGICLPGILGAQLMVKGKVTDETGEALVGVAIRVGDSGSGTLSDLDGNFELNVKDERVTLFLSYTGMRSLTYPLDRATITTTAGGLRQATLSLVLQSDVAQLKQVVVTAYRGAQERKDLVGSYEAVQLAELAPDRPEESIDKLLEGRIAGVQVNLTTGEPGLPVEVKIRGQSSLPRIGSGVAASTQPLFVLDGVPLFDVTETNSTGSVFSDVNSQRINPLTFLNPEDIESITVLKDASATALYGADAANGVVLITTKSVKNQDRLSFQVSYNQGYAKPIDEIKFLNTEEYVELARETLFNSNRNPAEAGTTEVFTDWRALVQRTSTNRDLDMVLSGGSAKGAGYRISAGYSELQGAHLRNGLEQLNLSVSLSVPLHEKLELGLRVNGSTQKREGISTYNAFSYPPNLPVRLADGSFNNDAFFARRPNPVAALEQNEDETNSKNLNSQINLSYAPGTTLQLRWLAGIDYISTDQFQYFSALNGSGAAQGGSLRLAQNDNGQWVSNVQASWSPQLGDAHHISLLGGGELNSQTQQRLVATGNSFPFDDLRQLRFLPADRTRVSESLFERRKASLYGELAYNYRYRYYLKLNGRRDASSIFGGDQQAQTLWALGSSWNISEEKWWGSQPLGISFAKLRLSYGITGNSRIGVYTARGLYRFTNDVYVDQVPLVASAPINDFLGWERKQQANLALDLGFGTDNPFRLTLEVYRNTTVDAITSAAVPLESGFTSVIANAASLRNQGVELTFHYDGATDRKWVYNSSFNVARNRNVLLDINTEDLPATVGDPRAFRIGEDVNSFYGIIFAGVDPATGKELFQLADGTITDEIAPTREIANLVKLGSGSPDFFGGWSHSLRHGRFTAAAQFNFSYGGLLFVNDLTFQDGRQILFNNQSVNQLDRWQQPGDVTDTPRPSIDKPLVSRSSRYVYQINYLQFASLSLNYRLKTGARTPLNTQQVNLFALVNNLGYWYDEPRRENRNTIAEYRFNFPQQRAVVVGVKLGW